MLWLRRASVAPVLLKTTVTAILVKHGRVIGVKTDRGPLATPVVVIATGPYSKRVAALAGVDLPLRIIRRHRVTSASTG